MSPGEGLHLCMRALVPGDQKQRPPMVSGNRHGLVLHLEPRTGWERELATSCCSSVGKDLLLMRTPSNSPHCYVKHAGDGTFVFSSDCHLGAREPGQILWVGASVAIIVATIWANCKKASREHRRNFNGCPLQRHCERHPV